MKDDSSFDLNALKIAKKAVKKEAKRTERVAKVLETPVDKWSAKDAESVRLALVRALRDID